MLKKHRPKLSLTVIIFLAFQFITINLIAQQATLTWLGTLGGYKSEAYGISDDGLVVTGYAMDPLGNPFAFKWTAANGMISLGTLGGTSSTATGISSDGTTIVGFSGDSTDIYRAFKWTEADGMQDLGAGNYSKATSVSSNGTVITVNVYPIAYRWTLSGGLENLGNLGGNSTGASAVSADGSVIVGYSNNAAGDPYAFRWINGTGMQQIGTFYSFANGVSGDGNTVTGSETGGAGFHRAFKWTQSGGFEFNIAGNFSQGNAVSGDGSIIVGDYSSGAFRLSATGGLEELNQVYSTLLTTGSELYSIWDISSDGQILVGSGRNGITGQDEGYLLAVDGINSVDESQLTLRNFVLHQNYPNPFNPSTSIQYQVSNISNISLKVYDVLGNEVATLVNEEKPAGSYEVNFNASKLSSGVYFYRIQAGSFVETKKMILLK